MTGPGPLALVGGGEFRPGNEAQDRVLAEAAGEGPSFVLATAAARQGPDLAVQNAREWFARLGLEVTELPAIRRADVRSSENANRARAGRFFYLVGGDPGLVPKTLAGTPVWEAIVEAWLAGAALGGSSAGAMALGEWTLVRERFPGDRNRRFTPALRLLPRVAVVPHFDTFGKRWVRGALAGLPDNDAILLGIDERTAAIWRRRAWRTLGPGGVTVFTGESGERFEAGNRISGLPHPLLH